MIVVTAGPFTLCKVTALATNTRLVPTPPGDTRPPVWYTPLVTSTTSPAAATSTASWMLVAAVAQLPYGAAGLGLFKSTYWVAARAAGRAPPHSAALKRRVVTSCFINGLASAGATHQSQIPCGLLDAPLD